MSIGKYDADEDLCAKALTKANGANIHDVMNIVLTYKNYCFICNVALGKSRPDYAARLDNFLLERARWAHAVALIADGVSVDEARRRAKKL